jgi:hypothetical protein
VILFRTMQIWLTIGIFEKLQENPRRERSEAVDANVRREGLLRSSRRSRNVTLIAALAFFSVVLRCWPQERPDLDTYLKDSVRLSNNQIKAIHSGKAVTKALPSRIPDEVFLFGIVHLYATPETYVHFATDFDRLRQTDGYLAIGTFSTPPVLADLNGFTLDRDDINSLRKCKPRNCQVQMPESSMLNIRQSIDWSAPNRAEQVNQVLQREALERLDAYQRNGNVALGTYDDKQHPTDVAAQFGYILTYSRALPGYLPDLYNYLLSFPDHKSSNVDDSIYYWANVKFGLKPTLRIVHIITMRFDIGGDPAYVIAEKQLYASHYFQTALDLTFCISDTSGPERRGFYLIKVMGSKQEGLTGFKGPMVRRFAVNRSISTLQRSLTEIKTALEALNQN